MIKIKKRGTKLHLILVSMVVILALLQIIFANRLTEAGKNLRKLEEESASLEAENSKLKTEIAVLGSIERLKSQTEKLGFVPQTSIINLTIQKPIAFKF